MKQQWIEQALELSRTPSSVYSGDRKILTDRTIVFDGLDGDVPDVGYTDKKANDLARLYLHEESHAVALKQWRARRDNKRRKPFTVAFHTFNHLLKAERKNGVGSVMGPCLLSVVVGMQNGNEVVVVNYRSVEFFRAFAADLAFVRDVLLAPFALRLPFVRFQFAHLTCHPRDFPLLLCNVADPLAEMMALKRADRRFHELAVRWLSSYVLEERADSIANYDRGKRGQRAVLSLMKADDLDDLRDHCRRQFAKRQSRGVQHASGAVV